MTIATLLLFLQTTADTVIAWGKAISTLWQDPVIRAIIITAVCVWIFSIIYTAAVTSLRTPKETDSERYKFWFKFLHNIAGCFKRARKKLHDPTVNGDNGDEKEKTDAANA